MFSLSTSTRRMRAVALAGVTALVATLTLVTGVATAPSAEAATPSLTVTPVSATKLRVTGKYPHKVGGKVTALYIMACANPGSKRPSSQHCIADWKGSSSALTIAPKDASARTVAMYGSVLKKTGTVKNGVWTFTVDITLPKSIKVKNAAGTSTVRTVTCGTTNKTCGIGTRLSASVSTSSKAADKFVYGSKKSAKITTTTTTLKSTAAGKATVKVATTGISKPTGTVKITVGGKSVSRTLKSTYNGKMSLTLPKLKKGTYTLKTTFTPSSSTKYAAKTTSKSIKVTVK